jgi:hypothetical protein
VKLTLEECVRGFLELALVEPETPPKTQRARHENTMMIIGFNRAQETLRTILAEQGAAEDIKKISEVRAHGQRQPMAGPGGAKIWVAG